MVVFPLLRSISGRRQEARLLKKLYRMQDDLLELSDYFRDDRFDKRMLKRVERMQYRVNYFIEKLRSE